METVFRIPFYGTHNFQKQNGGTLEDSNGQYDSFKCTVCGIKGKSHDLNQSFEYTSPRRNLNAATRKKLYYCTLSDNEINRIKAADKFEDTVKLSLPCPECGKQLGKEGEYTEEGTDRVCWNVICMCGYSALIVPPKAGDKSITIF